MAAGAGPKDIHDVLGFSVAVFVGNRLSPGLDLARFNLGCCPTFPANQVMVVSRGTRTEEILAFDTERISASLFRQRV